ncbi:MAG: GNAT family N-acetyltransferase [Gloeomargarita sp. GMQP_bins_120]
MFWKGLFTGAANAEAPAGVGEREILLTEWTTPQGERLPIYFSTTRDIDVFALEALCDAVGWAKRPLRKVRKALAYSFLVGSLWLERQPQRRLIGFARATSDHAFNATIWDVVIHPEFQGKGLGKALMRQMIRELRRQEISNITLFADPHVVSFYEELGFHADPEGIKGMFWYPS